MYRVKVEVKKESASTPICKVTGKRLFGQHIAPPTRCTAQDVYKRLKFDGDVDGSAVMPAPILKRGDLNWQNY